MRHRSQKNQEMVQTLGVPEAGGVATIVGWTDRVGCHVIKVSSQQRQVYLYSEIEGRRFYARRKNGRYYIVGLESLTVVFGVKDDYTDEGFGNGTKLTISTD